MTAGPPSRDPEGSQTAEALVARVTAVADELAVRLAQLRDVDRAAAVDLQRRIVRRVTRVVLLGLDPWQASGDLRRRRQRPDVPPRQ